MNEKIRKLSREKADYWMNHYDRHSKADMSILYEDIEKFAELIVQECAGIVEDYGLSLVGSDENYLGETLNLSIRVQEAGNQIKKHFGVEE